MQAFNKPPYPTSKRSACDRCRNQKLRCPPRESINDTCSRCKRAGVGCFTSFTKPLGRKSKNNGANATSQQTTSKKSPSKAASKVAENNGPDPATVLNRLPLDAHPLSQAHGPSPIVAASPLTAHMSQISSPSHPLPASWSWMSADAGHGGPAIASGPFRNHSYASELSDALTLSDATNPPDIVDHMFDEYDPFSPFQFSPTSEFMDPCDDMIKPTDMHSLAVEPEMHNFEYDTRISKLGLELSMQLEGTVGRQSRFASVSAASPTDLTDQDSPSDTPRNGNNAFSDALRGMSEFLDIVQSHNQPGRFSTAPAKQANKALPSIIVTLNLVSVYLQIVLIYDNLFVRLYEQLCAAAHGGSPSTPFQSLPGMWLAGFPVNQSDLQTKLLVQAILHQFETIEKKLGLPQEFRISGRGATGGGLLDNARSRNLLNAMLSGKCAQVGLESICGLRALDSLRDSVEKVRHFLEM